MGWALRNFWAKATCSLFHLAFLDSPAFTARLLTKRKSERSAITGNRKALQFIKKRSLKSHQKWVPTKLTVLAMSFTRKRSQLFARCNRLRQACYNVA